MVVVSAALKRLFAQGLVQLAISSQARYAQEFPELSAVLQDEVLGIVEGEMPAFFEALVTHPDSGYYSHPTVRRLLGLEAHPPQPRGHQLEPFDLRLLERVKQRTPLYCLA